MSRRPVRRPFDENWNKGAEACAGVMRHKTVELRFYGNLVDFVPGGYRHVERTFDVAPSVKDTIEAAGVPHPEVDLVLVDGVPVDWGHTIADGERIAVYPRFRSLDISLISPVHVEPLAEARFVVDEHLRKLARYLRLLGFDTLQPDGVGDERLADISATDGRAVLTRDLGLLKRTIVTHGYFVRSIDPVLQCSEVVQHFEINDLIDPYTRCMACNGVITSVGHDCIADHVPPAVADRHDRFRHCTQCGRVYWEGTHVARLDEVVAAIRLLSATGD